MDCPICLEPLNNDNQLKLKCNHSFHSKCLIQVENSLCPLCREPFSYTQFGYNFQKICYGNHIYGYSPFIKNGKCRICNGLHIKLIISMSQV
jgi:hypothetical protein